MPSTSPSSTAATPLPTLSAVLDLLLPLSHTLSLSLDSLNKSKFAPESKDEDLHAGVLQLPQGTVLLVSEGGVREGQLLERGAPLITLAPCALTAYSQYPRSLE